MSCMYTIHFIIGFTTSLEHLSTVGSLLREFEKLHVLHKEDRVNTLTACPRVHTGARTPTRTSTRARPRARTRTCTLSQIANLIELTTTFDDHGLTPRGSQ